MRQKFHIDFIGHSKIYFGISIGIMLICLICNLFVFHTELDIQFTGGTILKYTYTGDVSESDVSKVIQDATAENVSFQFSQNLAASQDLKNDKVVSVEFTETKAISVDDKAKITEALQKEFKDNSFVESESTSVDPSKGLNFFLKCLVAVAVAALLMIVYVGIRFRKIGGLSAGTMAIVAIIHDLIIVYFTFVMFRMPLDDNFIAVVLMILGYSLNDTIVIYDRIRENRKKAGPRTSIAEITNDSINQCLTRTICTSITTLIAISAVLIVAVIYNIDSVVSFALPMMFGLITGCYSSICIACPLWVLWTQHKDKKKSEKRKKTKAEKEVKAEV